MQPLWYIFMCLITPDQIKMATNTGRNTRAYDGLFINDVISYIGFVACVLLISCVVVFIWRHLPNHEKQRLNDRQLHREASNVGATGCTIKTETPLHNEGVLNELQCDISPSETYSDVGLRNFSILTGDKMVRSRPSGESVSHSIDRLKLELFRNNNQPLHEAISV